MGTENRAHIEITTQIGCPVGCRYCPQAKLVQNYRIRNPTGWPFTRDLSLRQFETLCKKIPPEVDIHFSGMCEPFVNPYAIDMVEVAARKHSVSIFTTLTGLDIADYDRLLKLPFRWFCVHVPDGQLNTGLKCTPEYLELLQYVVWNKPYCERFWISMHGDYHPALIPIIGECEVENTIIDRAGNLDIAWADKTVKDNPVCSCGDYNQNVLLPDGTVLLCCMDYSMVKRPGEPPDGEIRGDRPARASVRAVQEMQPGGRGVRTRGRGTTQGSFPTGDGVGQGLCSCLPTGATPRSADGQWPSLQRPREAMDSNM